MTRTKVCALKSWTRARRFARARHTGATAQGLVQRFLDRVMLVFSKNTSMSYENQIADCLTSTQHATYLFHI